MTPPRSEPTSSLDRLQRLWAQAEAPRPDPALVEHTLVACRLESELQHLDSCTGHGSTLAPPTKARVNLSQALLLENTLRPPGHSLAPGRLGGSAGAGPILDRRAAGAGPAGTGGHPLARQAPKHPLSSRTGCSIEMGQVQAGKRAHRVALLAGPFRLAGSTWRPQP
jgi:hypothetical protein